MVDQRADRNAKNSQESDLHTEVDRMIGVFRRGWRLILITPLALLALSVVYLARTKAVYQAESRLLILQLGGRPLNVTNTDPNRLMEGTEDYVPTHAQIINSPAVVKRAIETVGMENLPSLDAAKKAGLDPVELAILNLKVVRPDRLAKILRVEYQAGERKEAVRTVEEIITSYKKFLDSTFQKNNSTTVELIEKARDGLGKELEDTEAHYLELRRKTPELTNGEEHRSFVANRLATWDRATNDARVKAVQLKAQLALGQKLAREGTDLWAIAQALGQIGGDTGSLTSILSTGARPSAAEDYIHQLSQEQQQLAERFGPQYVKVKELQAQLDRIRERVRGARREGSEVRDLLNAMSHSLEAVQAMRDEFAGQVEKDQELAKDVDGDLLAEEQLHGKLERDRALYSTVVDQLRQAHFVNDYSSTTAQILEPPKALLAAVWPRPIPILSIALALGVLLGLVAAVLCDRLDQRIRSLHELRELTDLPLLGQVAHVPDVGALPLDSVGLISFVQPVSAFAEQYRTIRTNVDFLLRRSPQLHVIQVTSSYPSEGKSTTISNLAISFATAGRRVLLIDADLRRPTQNDVHQLTRDRGLTQLLQDRLPVVQVVRPSQVEGLDIMTAGPEVSNPAELLSSPRLKELLDEARQTYDLILLDSPPLLAVADAAIVGAFADGIILVNKPTTTRRHEIVKSMELLRSLGTSVLGIIVNDVSREDRMEGYGYGYGYRYGYGYGGKSNGQQATERSGAVSRSAEIGQGQPAVAFRTNGKPVHGLTGERPAE